MELRASNFSLYDINKTGHLCEILLQKGTRQATYIKYNIQARRVTTVAVNKQ